MKKWLKTGKKTLSVIMAVMMVLSAWVWVAPTEAEAATAGNYKVKVFLDINDGAYAKDQTIYVDYYTNNGTGTASTSEGFDFGSYDDGDITAEFDNIGFPYQVRVYSTGLYWGVSEVWYGINVSVTAAGGSSYTSLYTENDNVRYHKGTNSFTDTATIDKSKFPYVNTFPSITVNRDIYLPTMITTGRYSSNSVTVGQAKDQYGVNYMDAETITVSGSACGTTGLTTSKSGSVLTVTGANTAKNENGTSQTATVVAKWKSANTSYDTESEYRSKTYNNAFTIYNPEHRYTYNGNGGTVNVDSAVKYYAETIGDSFPSSGTRVGHTFLGMFANQHTVSYDSNVATSEKLTSSRIVKENKTWYAAWQANLYIISFNYKDAAGTNVTETQNKYYGQTVTAPVPPAIYAIPNTDYDYAFLGWSPEVGTTVTGNATYTANYDDGTKVYADYTEVDTAIAAADAIKANYGTDYELKYTFASRSALNDAINDVVRGLGRTRQSDVDGFAAEINAKIAALEPNKFDVIFLDKDGAILLYEKDVEYKESVAAPDYNEIYYDATNHYTFTGWDTDEYTSVVDDLVIQPVFTAEGHTYTTETVTSNCVTKGATKYTCSCGYSYIDGESDYGDHVWATEFTTDLEPTCTVAGSKSVHCTLCDAQKAITEIPPLGHQWSSQSVAVEATCGKIGIMAKVCDDCGVCEHTIIDALEHDFEEKVVAPTCTTKGYTEYTCKRDNCGYSYRDNYTDVIDHTYGNWETVSNAYCGVEGVKKQTCTECGYVNIGSINALEHNLSGWTDVVAQTCTGKGYQVKTCSLCGNVIEEQWLDALGHNYVVKTVVAPTCESKGYTVEECNRAECGAQRIVDEEPALNHDWTSTRVEADCTHSTYIEHVCANDASHNYIEYVNGSTALLHDFTGTETIVSAATCETDGEKTVKCSRCDVTTTVIIPKLGHSYSEWDKTTNPATNDKDGTWTRKCANCGDVETLTVPKGGHNLVEDEEQYVAPMCNTKGQRVYKCDAHTDCTVTVTVELDYAQHNVIQEVTTEATCTTKGSVKAYCSDCSKTFSTTEIPEKAHNPVAGEAVAPTCTTSGYTPYACSCGSFSYNLYDASNPATGHDFDETITANVTTVAATCTADGSKTVKCADCDEENTVVLPATGHSFVENTAKATAATCTALATKTYECSCGASYVERYGALAAHQFNTLVKTVPATNDSLGYEERKCVCGLTEITILEATGTHVFDEKIDGECVAPTCTENGTDVYKCTAHTDCGAKSSVLVPRLGHTVTAVYNAPTCTAEGSSEAYCTTCNTTVATTVIPVTAHNYSAAVTIPATCEGEGTMTYTCSCGANYTEAIPATGHKLSVDITEANCTDGGKVVVTCDNCNDPSVEKTVEFAANGHSWNSGEETVPADCDSEGEKTYTCTLCGETKTETIPATGHTWGDWVVTPSTNDNPGSVTRECSVCKKNETIEIPAGNHKLVVDDSKSTPATCKADGKLVYICDNHNDCGITVTVTTAKLQHTVAQREIEATCTKEGSVEAYCSVCNDVLSTEAIPVKAHSYEAQTAVAPTCTTSGYTPYKCSSCGDTYNVYDASKPATGHNLVEGTSTASCIAGGQMTLTCKNCTYSTTVNVPAKGHSYEKQGETVAATCTTPSTEIYKCANCNDTYTKFISGTVDHSWSGWSTIQEATTVSYGIEKRECSVCHTVEHKTTAPTGAHDFEKLSETPATCTQPGSIAWKCKTHTDCEANYTETLDKLPHSQKISYTAPTCIADGSSKIVCENCSTVIKSETISATGCHDFSGEGVTADATCTQTGTITYTCLTDGCTATKVVTIPAKGHSLTTIVTDAKCGEKGSVVTACSRCDYTSTTELAAKGHIWGEYTVEKNASCTEDGKKVASCTNADCTEKNEIVIPKLGHSWSTWSVIPSTNEGTGSVSRECTVCDKTESIEIPAGGHELVLKSENKATCENEGTQLYGCKNHTDCGITVTVTTAMLHHTLKTEITKEATCDTNGEVVTSCESCKATLVTTIIPATGHNYKGEVTKKATCTEEGVRTYTCAHDATHTYTEPIAKLQHNYVAGEAVEATCISSGYTPYSCACGSSYMIITAPAKGHSFSEKVSSTADCTTDGVMTLKCACGETMETKVPALGHNYVENEAKATAATCAAAATKTYECSRCDSSYTISAGEKTTDHTWGAETVVDATNTSLGYKTRTCTVCGQVYFEIIPATGEHNFNIETADKLAPTCTVDGYIVYACSADHNCNLTSKVTVPATGHKETISYEAPTCTEDGYTKIICEVADCDYEKDATTIPALGHIWVQEKLTPATCNSKGSIEYSCKNCTETYTVEFENKDAHNFNTITVLASCDAEGSVTVTCSNGCGYNQTAALPKLGHDWGDWKVETPATNTTSGVMERTCSNGCVDTCVIPAGGHEFNTNNPASTTTAYCNKQGTATYNCTAHDNCGVTITVNTGYAEHTYKTDVVESCSSAGSVKTYCTVCGDVFANITLGLAQHTYDKGVETAPTCTSSGYTLYTCTKCGHTYKEIGAAPVGHEIVKSESKADCTTGDTIVISCKNCDFKQEVEVPALGHDYRLNSETDATCAAAATETYKCSRCEASYTISVGDKTEDHDWNDWTEVEKATYTSLGYKIRTCKICGKLEVRTIPATGDHVFDELVSETAPDCENDGEKVYACSVHTDCGLTSVVTVPANGHIEKIEYKAPTCKEDGYSKMVCDTCKETIGEVTTITATCHVYGNGVITAAATCKTPGNIKYTCSCGDVMNAEIPVDTSAHNFDTDIQQASCTADGKVTVTCLNGCDYKKETVIPAKGHTFTGEEVTVSNATCTDDGEKTVKCINCDEVDRVVIPKLGHSMKAGAAVAPTCTTSGYTPYTCGNAGCDHGYNVYDGTKPAKGHTWGGWTIVTAATKDSEGLKRRSCTVCSNATEEQIIPAMKHELTVLENVASTCTKAGHITYKCVAEHDGAACDFIFNVDLPVKQHTLSTAVNDATCVAEGSVVTECTVPGCGYNIVTPIPAIAHKLGTLEHYPSCTDKGYTKVYCENSYCDYEVISEIAPLGHNYDDSIEANVEVVKDATCTQEGLMTVKCSRAGCNEVKEVVIPKLNHVFKEEKTVNATCTESGYILMKCENCTETYNEFVSDPKGHNWNDGEITKPATCTENGEITYTCTNDAKHTYTQPIAKLGHDWGEWKVTLNPTATVEGIQSRECKVCHTTENATIPALGGTTTYTVTFIADGKTVATQIVIHNGKATAPEVSKPYDADYHYSYIWDTDFSRVTSDLTVTAIFTPAAHSYGEWVVDNAASCDNEGLRHRSCACGYVQYETLESTEHSFIVLEGGVPATCTENGFERVECEICHKTEERVLKRLGHVMTYHQAIDPTCDEDGVAGHYSCSRCAKNFKDRAGQNELDNVVVSKRYHTFIVVPGNEATCTKDGTTDYMYCTVCGYNRISETIPAFGHSDANNDGTCDNCGSTYMQGGSIVCSCSCHKNGFFNELIYKILSFFWRLFGMNKSCECGKVHY